MKMPEDMNLQHFVVISHIMYYNNSRNINSWRHGRSAL